jgi:L-ornithine N5-monooxygenase
LRILEPDNYDVVGLGFGPANLSLAIALKENRFPLTAMFFERQAVFGWHRDMLVPSSKMQVSFLKDLATFRNPTSRFSFVSYLHARNRLARFVNKRDFFPTRQEFHDYLEWAASEFTDVVTYGAQAVAVRLPPGAGPDEPVDRLCVDVRKNGTAFTVDARNVVVSTGLVPRMPAGVDRHDRVWHSSQFLGRFARCDPATLKRVAVVGAGQSAAELVRFLYDQLPDSTVYAITPSSGYAVADSTPFVNEIFDAVAVDEYYHGSARAKDAIWRYHSNTNYSVVDDELIRDLYHRAYDDEVSGGRRLEFMSLYRLTSVEPATEGARLTLHSLATEQSVDLAVDLVVCATGYQEMAAGDLLGELDAYCVHDRDGGYVVERDYRVLTSPAIRCGIYLQGATERTHGLSSSLLSNLAIRGGDIGDSIIEQTSRRAGDEPDTRRRSSTGVSVADRRP